MLCPYCTSEIKDEALVCPICRRDLFLFKPLLARIGELETKLAAQEERLTQIPVQESDGAAEDEPVVRPSLRAIVICWLGPWLLLIAAHGLITMLYDWNTLYLRIVSLAIPLPFGFMLASRERHSPWVLACVAASLSVLAVLMMSAGTSAVDGTPVLPANLREWREFIEYATSIALSYAAGLAIGRMLRLKTRQQAQENARAALALQKLIRSGAAKTENIQKVATRFYDFWGAVTAAAATAGSIFTGLQGFINK